MVALAVFLLLGLTHGLNVAANAGGKTSDRAAYLRSQMIDQGFDRDVDLQAAINRFIAEHNTTEAKPFVWRDDPDDIIAARNRGFQMLDSFHSHVRHFKGQIREIARLPWQALRSSGYPWAKQEARSLKRRLIML